MHITFKVENKVTDNSDTNITMTQQKTHFTKL